MIFEPVIHKDIIQGTPEWDDIRRGKFGGSKCLDLFAKPDTAAYRNLINNIVYEIKTGKTIPTYRSQEMLDGIMRGPEARSDFEFTSGLEVTEIGYVSSNEYVGMSPDGFVYEHALIEIKCPKATTQISYLDSQQVPKRYIYQMQYQMMISERLWCYFYSYHPDLKEFTVKVNRDEEIINSIKEKLELSVKEVKRILANVN